MIRHHQEKPHALDTVSRREGTDAVPELPVRRGHEFDHDPPPRRHALEVSTHRLGLRTEHDHEVGHPRAHTRQHGALAQRHAQNLRGGLRRTVFEGRESDPLACREDDAT